MAGNKTLTIIKPYAVKDGYIGSDEIQQLG